MANRLWSGDYIFWNIVASSPWLLLSSRMVKAILTSVCGQPRFSILTLVTLCYCSFSFNHLSGQSGIPTTKTHLGSTEISFGINHIDRNFRLEQKYHIGRHHLRFGIKYILKIYPIDDQSFGYRLRAYPQSLKEHLGLQIGYGFQILKLPRGVESYLFYDFQISKPAFLGKYYVPNGLYFDPRLQTWMPILLLEEYVRHPQLSIEQNCGIGLEFPLSKNLYVNEMAGLGIAAFRDDFVHNGQRRYFYYDPIFPFLRLGLSWRWSQ